ncbi:glutamate receptor ionotropic, kainate glr-3-like [Calliopsis andreniformis]|uniref:glutamate receptor ionotropic, kainate glr-3-like n=1 Tax=Calliopsis andreniformis TaxID=337506 RepID=UPI003FCE1FB3
MIWDKNQQNFVVLSNVSRFANFEEYVLARKQDPTVKDISGRTLKVSYYEERDLIMFYENDTKVTGVCGEIWNLLANMLNITLIPVHYMERDFGISLENGSYTGLLGLLDRNETEVIMRTGYYSSRINLLDYTLPIWRSNFQLYIKPKYTYDSWWVATMFSSQTWCVLIFSFVLLSMAGYIFQNEYNYQTSKRGKKVKRRDKYFDFTDHVFYTYSTMCCQGYLPEDFHKQNRILSLSKSVFAWLVLLTFSSNLIYRMAHRTMTPPFTDFSTLMNKTKYDVLTFRGSTIYEFLKNSIEQSNRRYEHRIHFMNDSTLMYENVCKGDHLYAMLEVQDKVDIRNKYFCSLIPMGGSYYQTWYGFGLRKHLPYKKIINMSILKLYETGLLDALKDRWFDYRVNRKNGYPTQAIDMQQVYLIFYVLLLGIVLSFIIVCLEKIIKRNQMNS